MPLTKVGKEGITGISNSSDANAVTIDSSEKVGIGTSNLNAKFSVSGTGTVDLGIGSTNAGGAYLYLDGDSNGDFSGSDYSYIAHDTSGQLLIHQDSPSGSDNILFRTGGNENLRLTNSVTGSGFTADSGTSIISPPIHAIRATSFSRSDTYYDFPIDSNGGCYVIAGMSHDQQPSTYGKFANFQVAHSSTLVSVQTSEAYGSNGQLAISKPNTTTLRVTFNKDESSGSGTYFTVEFVAVFGSKPF